MVPILPEKNCPDLTSEVRRTVEALSAAWRERRYDALAALFADDMVFALPGFTGRLEGGPAIVASYREFMDRVELTHYQEDAPTIDVWGDTAVVSYRWDMAWVAGGVPSRETGHDVFVFRRTAPGDAGAAPWRAIWRTMTFDQPERS